MAEEVRNLLLQVDAQVELLRRGLTDAEKAVEKFERDTRKRLDKTDQRFALLGKGFTGFGATMQKVGDQVGFGMRAIMGGLGILGTGAALRTLAGIADESKNIAAQLRLATSASGDFARAQADVRRIAQETRSGLAVTADLYGKFQRNAKELGITQTEAARATETVAKAFKISGSSASEEANGIRQFSQALASGVLRGDEFNSIMENAPRLAKLLADSLGVPVGALRAMAEEGQLTSDKLLAALTQRKFTEAIDAEFKGLPVTFDQAMEQISNAAIITFGAFDRGGSFSTMLANFVTDGVDGFNNLETRAETMGVEIRAILEGLRNAFFPMEEGARTAIGNIKVETLSLRDSIASLLGTIDTLRNIPQLINNAVERKGDSALNTLPNQLGFGDIYTPKIKRLPSTLKDDFLASSRRAELDQRLRLIMSAPIPGVEWAGAGLGPRPTVDKTRQIGRTLTGAEADAILAGIGARVTSGARTPARNAAVGGATNSLHLSDRARDIAKTPGMSLGTIKAAFEAQGVRLTELLDEGDHFHVGWGGKGRGRQGPSPETIANRAEAARVAAERRQQAFDNELANRTQDLTDARAALVTSAEISAQLEKQNIETERVRYNDSLASQVSTKKLTQAEADQLQAINDETAALRTRAIDLEEQHRLRQEALQAEQARVEIEAGDLANRRELLQSAAALVDTAAERRQIELDLLNLSFEEERLRLRAIIAESERLNAIENATESEKQAAKDAATAAELARRRLAALGGIQANAQEGVIRGTMGPLESYLSTLPDDADKLNEALERVRAQGLQSLEDGIVDVITGTKSLGEAFKDVSNQIIADLIRIGVQRMIIAPLADSLFGPGQGNPGGGGGAGGILGSLFSAGMSIFGGGAAGVGGTITPLAPGAVPMNIYRLPGFAAGGFPAVGRPAIVGEKGPEIFVPTVPGRVIPNHALGGMGGELLVRVEGSDDFYVKVDRVSGRRIRAEAPAIATQGAVMGQVGLRRQASRRLP